ncbi:hypothetical protein [Pseudoroseicyclus tamaricis]|uniref:hypothetical protein n=1 Tax=Pseudoroseicyclus tamaricis TaxID=2705421 RepID=UPI002E2DD635|nr:hypothetical protein [Pseudoroseicyclus tamaricis]
MTDLPKYFYRIRENGAAVFEVETENRERRLELNQIAVANWKNGDIKPHGQHELTEAERAEIEGWIAQRRALVARREVDDIHRAIDHLNLTAQWVQARATPEELEEVTDPLLLAMHDLRTILVRRKAERLAEAPARNVPLGAGRGAGESSGGRDVGGDGAGRDDEAD